MRSRIAVVGAAAAIIGGAGTAAYAANGTPAPALSSNSATAIQPATTDKPATGTKARANRLRTAVHATWVTGNKRTKVFTTHDAIRGLVTAVSPTSSPTSITVRAADGATETYVITPSTTVHTRALRSGASISDVRAGDPVFVIGTGTTTLSAVRVLDVRK